MAAVKSYPSSLLINVEDLLKLRGVESQRVEFKKAWSSEKGTKGSAYWQVIHTITAFANDLYNVNGGYIIIGVEEDKDRESTNNRQIIFPPFGVRGNLDRIQMEILRACRENIEPTFIPILQPEVVEGTTVLVIWVRPSDERPHTCKESNKAGKLNYYIREGTETKKAKREQISLLFKRKAPPFDDRKTTNTELGSLLNENSIDLRLVQQYLKDIDSVLVGQEIEPIDLYDKLTLVRPTDEKLSGVVTPRNVALLFFHPNPHTFFEGASTEIAVYTHDNKAKEEQEDFSGDNEVPPVPSRNRRIADFLKSLKLAEGRYTGVATIFRSMEKNKNPKPKFDFKASYFRVRLPGHPKYVRSRADNLCAKGDKEEAVRLITGFLEENPTMRSETLIVQLFDLLGDDKYNAKYHPYQEIIENGKKRRDPIKDELRKWSEADVTDIPAGVKLVKSLVEEGASIGDLSCVVSKASHFCQKNVDGEQNLEALQKAHMLYEAMGEVVQTDASVSLQFADCLYNMYLLNTANKGSEMGERSEGRQNLYHFL
ncbi:hypothetical protein AWC38_SpisGene11648 [Stylophora pistillata]|uniref:Schlafen AlbA-2 domain-containing protein n=1 Tax=Stylophora pistillata TaxID=50429 RepID=A0A2B4S404_STYPI|nr:hypothetical protein AWC38_SpisGene11648 [Stylophora pistillata]